MDLQGKRDLKLLTEVERDPGVTQRSLAKKLGVALGLTNLYLRRLAHKGYIKITTIPRKRLQYLLTPRGMAEKSRLTYQYLQYSLTYYRDMRQHLRLTLSELAQRGAQHIVMYGTGELAELAYVSLQEVDLHLVGVVDQIPGQKFLSYTVESLDVLLRWEFDAVLVCRLEGFKELTARLVLVGVPSQKVISLVPDEGGVKDSLPNLGTNMAVN